MPFSIQVRDKDNGFKQGECAAIRIDGFQYSEGDCLKEWLNAGRTRESWRDSFAIIYCTDENMDGTEVEVQALLELYSDNPDAEFKRRKYISLPPNPNNTHRVNIRDTGETSAAWSEISALIIERV